jgi:hypothetical protein
MAKLDDMDAPLPRLEKDYLPTAEPCAECKLNESIREDAEALLTMHRSLNDDARQFVAKYAEQLGINGELVGGEDLPMIWTQVERLLVLASTATTHVPPFLKTRRALLSGMNPLASILKLHTAGVLKRAAKAKTPKGNNSNGK